VTLHNDPGTSALTTLYQAHPLRWWSEPPEMSAIKINRWQEDQEIVAYSEVLFRHTLKRTVWRYARHCRSCQFNISTTCSAAQHNKLILNLSANTTCTMDLQEVGRGGMDWIELTQDRTGSGNFWARKWTFRFHKTRGISWLAENRLASQEGLCSRE